MMYRNKIREYYDYLSPSYRKVADYVLSHYYEVAFMTAAQLADAVDVDTTTVVRFSQRLGFNGYPDMLADVRRQVKAEIYAIYEPQELAHNDPASIFKLQIDQDGSNLRQILVQNPPSQLQAIAQEIQDASRIYFVAEGYVGPVAEMVAAQLRHQNIAAEAVSEDPMKRAATLTNLAETDLVIGISSPEHGDSVARALELARLQGCRILGVVGSLDGPVNRVVDRVIYAPSEAAGPLPSMVSLAAALTALAQTIIVRDTNTQIRRRAVHDAYHFLTRQPEQPMERAASN